jgi:DNA-binding NtrC family response regulator
MGAPNVQESGSIDLLIVDDDEEFRSTLVRRFQRRGFQVQEAPHAESALALAERRQFDVAIVDLVMPGMSGIELLEKLKMSQPECEAVLLTGQGTIETAVEAMKRGAYDFLTKPFPLGELELLIERAHERHSLRAENKQLKAIAARERQYPEIIGKSPAMQEVFRLIERAGPTDKAILIQGESGTGKELVARALHQASARAEHPLVVVNCAALPETLLESELFGHEKGSFTGAVATKMGLLELADGGTLMIDEIGEMPGSLQVKLLRVLEDGSMRRIGSLKEQRINVRLLAATNRDMEEDVHAGRFREDLFYRINVMALTLPPLRERAGDIRLLVANFLGDEWKMDDDALAALEKYDWPGNVRQLINTLDRAKILADDQRVRLRDLPSGVVSGKPTASRNAFTAESRPAIADDKRLADVERAYIVEVLQREHGNKARAARALGINRRSLYRMIEKHHIPLGNRDAPATVPSENEGL